MSRVGSSALVNVAEDAELRLVRHLAEAAHSTSPTFVQECEACISGGDAAKLMATIVAEKGAIEALSLDDEAVSVVSLLAALLDRAKDSKLVDTLAESLIQVSTDTTKTIALMATLYNMRSDAVEKISLMVKMIRMAAESQPSLLEPHASVLGKWMDASRLREMMDEWKVEPAARRPLYLAASMGAPNPVAKQRFTLLVLGTYASSVSFEQCLGSLLDGFNLHNAYRIWMRKVSRSRSKSRSVQFEILCPCLSSSEIFYRFLLSKLLSGRLRLCLRC